MNKKDLKKVVENHRHWLSKDCEGWENMKADLHGADLYGADLRDANLYGADLRAANLYRANLRAANLFDANLCGADLYGADLRDANLCDAILCGANLFDANLCGADLYGANLYGANLYGANLYRANLCGAKTVPFIPYACPDFGAFIGYKKAYGDAIVELEILASAKRCSATGRKCRCDKAKVLRILNLDKTVSDATEVRSRYDESFIYKVGEVVSVDDFCDDRWNECSAGIHFFISFDEAVKY